MGIPDLLGSRTVPEFNSIQYLLSVFIAAASTATAVAALQLRFRRIVHTQSANRGSIEEEINGWARMSSSAKRKRHDLHRSDDGRPTKKSESQLYVGNLDRTVTEYHMVQLMKPYGKVVMQEFMWHKSGPNRGMPRGYCFVEYATKAEAERAKKALHQKLFRGRPLVVQLTTERVQFYRDSDAAQGYVRMFRQQKLMT